MIEMGGSSDLRELFRSYLRARDTYFSNAEEAASKNEFRKASELLWGAITQSIKALASLSNRYITNHKQFFDFTRDVSKELVDEGYHTLFLELNTLHKNFYDEEIPSIDFPIFHKKALLFLRKTEELITKEKQTSVTSQMD